MFFVGKGTFLGIDFIGSTGQWYESFPIAVTHWMPLPEAPKGGVVLGAVHMVDKERYMKGGE